MNLIREIARRITCEASGIHTPEIYEIPDWIVQAPLSDSLHFQIADAWVFDDLCLTVAKSRISTNLLPQIPKIRKISEPFILPRIVFYTNIKVAPLEITELTDWFIESVRCSKAYAGNLTVPKTFPESIADFEVSILTEKEYPIISFEIAQVQENESIDIEIPVMLECCFDQKKYEENLEQQQEFPKEQKNQQEVEDQNTFYSPPYCKILHPILLPPLSLEEHDELDFHNPLRSYQKQGIRFLFENSSALLADEMGTGKTVQAVNALRLLFRQGFIKSALIVCPPAVIGSVDLSIETGSSEGWSGHFYHWAPELQVTVIRGGNKEKRKEEWRKIFHVYITTYDTLRIDLTYGILHDLQQFNCVVLDEAQKVKNRETKTAKAIFCLQAYYRWALTGTPIENCLDDVISLFDFIRPGTFLGGTKYSSQDVSNIIKPFMRRRLKKEILQELPEKEYIELFSELDQWQKTDYALAMEAARARITTILNGEKRAQIKLHIFALLPKLKQICNFAEDQSISPKAKLLLELLETIVVNQEKVLIFSQYLEEGTDKIANLLRQNRIGYVLYTGQVSSQQRERAVRDFKNNPEITVFLATTQAAGYGITLTEATYVIHFDHLWNPAKMQNAEDRIHRYGQEKGVTIYSLWMKDTIESRIKKKLLDKVALIDKTINCLATDLSEDDLSTEDWLDIFDIKLAKRATSNEELNARKKARRLAAKSTFQNRQDKLPSPIVSSHLDELEKIKKALERLEADSSQRTLIVYGNYTETFFIGELTIMSEEAPIFNQQGATIGVNYAASGSKQEFTQNVAASENNFEVLLADFERFINDLQQKHPNVTDETAIQIIDVEVKEIQQKQPLRWQNFLNLKRLWNGGKKAAFKVGEHYAEQNPLGKGALAFLEGVMEEPK